MTRQYVITCPSCNGVGQTTNIEHNPNVTASPWTIPCKACEGSGVVIVTEYSSEKEIVEQRDSKGMRRSWGKDVGEHDDGDGEESERTTPGMWNQLQKADIKAYETMKPEDLNKEIDKMCS